jgi:hypothetical protein
MSSSSDQLSEGMDVIDVEEKHVGNVVGYNNALGYFETRGTFSGPRYIPFWAIESFGPERVHLNVARSVVSEVYRHMPSVTPELSREGKLTGGGTVQSGITGRAVPLDADALRVVRERIRIGTSVIDADDKEVGTIEAYDSDSGYMRIEKDGLAPKEIFLPVTSVAFLDDQGIHLSDARDTIINRFVRVPGVARAFFDARAR